MSRNSQKPTVTVNKFPGLSTVDDAVEVGHTGLVKAINVDITRQQKIRRRKGATQKYAAVSTIDAACGFDNHLLLLQNDSLVNVVSDYTQSVVRSGLTPTKTLCALPVSAGEIIYSNGIETGRVVDGVDYELGVQNPPKAVVSKALFGQMVAGRYQVAYTYVRSDGFESGCGVAAVFDLDQDLSGLNIDVVASTNIEVDQISIYVTRPNGSTLYHAMTVDNLTATVRYNSHPNYLKRALRTQFKVPPPGFDVISRNDGRTMYAKDSVIYLSDPYDDEHITEGEAYFPFKSKVTMIGQVEGGTFVGTEKATHFIKGNTLEGAELDTVAPYGAVMGTLTYIDGALLGDGSVSDILPAWMSHKGLCVGMPDGSVTNLTQNNVAIPEGLKGTSMFRQEDGQNHIISVIQK